MPFLLFKFLCSLLFLYYYFRVKLKHFKKFTDTTEALSATTAAIEGKLSKTLRKTLKSLFAEEAHEALAVADAKLGSAIKGNWCGLIA